MVEDSNVPTTYITFVNLLFVLCLKKHNVTRFFCAIVMQVTSFTFYCVCLQIKHLIHTHLHFSHILISKSTFFTTWVCMSVNDYLLTWPSWTLINLSQFITAICHKSVLCPPSDCKSVLSDHTCVCHSIALVSASFLKKVWSMCVLEVGGVAAFSPLTNVFSAGLLLVTVFL